MNNQSSDGGSIKAHHILAGHFLKIGITLAVTAGTLSAVAVFLTAAPSAQSSSLKYKRRDNTHYLSGNTSGKGSSLSSFRKKQQPADKTKLTSSRFSLKIIREFPKNHSLDADGLGAIVVNFSSPLAKHTKHPTISPKVPGKWQKTNTSFVFRPSVPILPNTVETVQVPAGIQAKKHKALQAASTFEFATRAGSILRVDEVLSELGYLPFTFVADQPAERKSDISMADAAKYFWAPPAGTFKWNFTPPAQLAALWAPGVDNVMFQGALIAFESDHNLAMSTTLGTQDWSALFQASLDPAAYKNPHGYDYALAQETSPETLTVYDNGKVVLNTLANTGISLTPTSIGTFYVYEKLPYQVMKGLNPDGVPYADPVQYVSYFDGGEAVHYIYRAEYGFPQSLGCVELPFQSAATAYPYLTLGTLVTVSTS